MIELKNYRTTDQWWHPTSSFIPTQNLTAKEAKLLAEREALLDKLADLQKNRPQVWLKVTGGIFKGSIFPADIEDPHTHWDDEAANVGIVVDNANRARCSGGTPLSAYVYQNKLDPNKGWDWADRSASVYCHAGTYPIGFKEATIYPEFFRAPDTMNLLIDYQGDRVFEINEKKRPLVFTDRLEQEVAIGDLVVVALNYGAGLDICTVKGFADDKRVVIESVETGERDRIPLENNETKKIMRMPNSLRDTALLIKLAKR